MAERRVLVRRVVDWRTLFPWDIGKFTRKQVQKWLSDMEIKSAYKCLIRKGKGEMPGDGIEPPTRGFSVHKPPFLQLIENKDKTR